MISGQLKESDARQFWFGSVPETWPILRNKNAFELKNKKVGSSWNDETLLSLTKRGVIVRDVLSGKGKFPASFEDYQIVRKSNVVFCLFDIDETPRTVGLSEHDGMITGAYNVFKCKDNIDPRFITYFYIAIDERKGLKPFYTGLRKVVRFDTFMNAPIPIPGKEIQKGIADFLDRETARIDLLIDKKQHLKRLKTELNNSLLYQRLKALENKYEIRKLSHVSVLSRGRFNYRPRDSEELYGGSYPFLQTGDVARSNKYIRSHQQSLSELGASISKKFTAGSVLMAIAANVGDVAILDFDAYCPDSVVGFQPSKQLRREYLYYVLKNCSQEISKSSTSNAQDNTNIARLSDLKILFPPIDVQDKLSAEFSKNDDKLFLFEEKFEISLKLLREYKTALITAAVTGQINVKSYGKSGAVDRRLDQLQDEGRA